MGRERAPHTVGTLMMSTEPTPIAAAAPKLVDVSSLSLEALTRFVTEEMG